MNRRHAALAVFYQLMAAEAAAKAAECRAKAMLYKRAGFWRWLYGNSLWEAWEEAWWNQSTLARAYAQTARILMDFDP
jgi:hypothetical protein